MAGQIWLNGFLSKQKHRKVSFPTIHHNSTSSLGSLQVPVEGIAALEDAFNNCIESLLKYCSLRQRPLVRHETLVAGSVLRDLVPSSSDFYAFSLLCREGVYEFTSSENQCLRGPQLYQ